MSTHNLCFEQEYEKYRKFLSEKFPFLVVKFSIYLNRRAFVMFVLFPRYLHLYFYYFDWVSICSYGTHLQAETFYETLNFSKECIPTKNIRVRPQPIMDE